MTRTQSKVHTQLQPMTLSAERATLLATIERQKLLIIQLQHQIDMKNDKEIAPLKEKVERLTTIVAQHKKLLLERDALINDLQKINKAYREQIKGGSSEQDACQPGAALFNPRSAIVDDGTYANI